METKYDITGMSCAACSARVEKAVSSLDGVEKCNVNLLTNSMIVSGSAKSETIISAVENAGYGASECGNSKKEASDTKAENPIKPLKNRLIYSLIFLLILMYISMGHTMWGLPVPEVFANDPVSLTIAQLILSSIILIINQKFFVSGFKAAIRRSPNMDTLVALGSGAAFVYSTYVLFAMSMAQSIGDTASVHKYMHDLYFESAAMILTLITVGKMLEAFSKGKTTNALNALMKLTPKKARVVKDGVETEINASELLKDDIFVVKPGESIPADGIVIDGTSSVDESALTGESVPVDKEAGSRVSAATINKYGYMQCRATNVGEDTSLAKIIKMVSDAASGKAPIAKIADKVSGVFVPTVIIIAVITIIVWLMLGKSAGFALARGISVLVVSCPCALGLATPVAIMVGNGVGAKNGILFKTAESLEQTGKIKVCIFDKTGTVTKGKPSVTDVKAFDGCNEKTLLTLAYSLEKMSEHPLSYAIVEHCSKSFDVKKQAVPAPESRAEYDIHSIPRTNFSVNSYTTKKAEDFCIHPGNGLSATIDGSVIRGGNAKYISSYATIEQSKLKIADELSGDGKTPLFFALDDKVLGIIAVADTIKDDSKDAIESIKKMGIKTVMLTGDNQRTANAIGKLCGVDEIIAGVHPDGKEQVVRQMQKSASVAMVGDGINDAPALTSANVGIAIGAGVDIAIDAADVVVTSSMLSDVASAIILSRKTLRNIKENLFWAFCYNIIGIPLAAGVWISALGWEMNPMFGAAAMSLSSFCVVTNALRLNFIKIKNTKNETQICEEKENVKMEKTFNIEGMMCPHCEARVKKVLEEIDGVEVVVASHEKNNAILTLSKNVDDSIIIKTIEEQGYKVK